MNRISENRKRERCNGLKLEKKKLKNLWGKAEISDTVAKKVQIKSIKIKLKLAERG